MFLDNSPSLRMLYKTRLLKESVAWYDSFKNNPEIKKEIVNMIQNDQLISKGEDGKGVVIGYYSMRTERINSLKKFNTHYTLKDTGNFFKSMFVTVLSDSILIEADARKMENKDWWSVDILTLNDENLRKLVQSLEIKYIAYARKILFDS